MALPREPRQKMINMMYLVLTAMLALNVSSEIINAFRVVNESIQKTNGVISGKNELTYRSLEDKEKDAKTAEQAKEWRPLALQAKALSDEIYNYIEGVKKNLKVEAELKVKDGKESFKEDNLEASTRYLVEKGEGKTLLQKLTEFRDKLLAIHPEIKSTFANTLPINLGIPAAPQEGSLAVRDWSSAYFRMTPTIAAITMLSKFQNDVKNSEAMVVDFCHSKVGQVQLIYDQFAAFAGTNSTYLMPGQPFELTAGIGSFSAAAKPSIYVNGSNIPVGPDGTAMYKETAGGSGTRNITVKIEYTKPNGEKGVVEKQVSYTVGVPAGAAVMLDKMNVLYRGVDNPVTVASGAGLEKTSVSINNGSISGSGGKYTARVSNLGEATITVTADGKPSQFRFRVKDLPPPTAFVGDKSGGRMPAAQFRAMGGLRAALLNAEFDVNYSIASYKMGFTGKSFPDYVECANSGNQWSNCARFVGMLKPGDNVFFDDIRAVGPGGNTVKLSSIGFSLY